MNPRIALNRLGGIGRTSQLRRLGVSEAELGTAWADGEIDRVRKGVYAIDRRSPVAVAAAHGGALTCVSALAELGVWVLSDGYVHVEVGRNGRVHPHSDCACIDHHTQATTRFGLDDCAAALISARRCLSVEGLLASYESAVRQRLLGGAGRAHVLASMPSDVRGVLDRAREDADSGVETIFRHRLELAGIRLESQVWIEGVGRVDFRHGRVIFEIDGRLNHDGPSARHKDLVRDAAARRRGFTVVRFDYAMVMHDWPGVLATVRAVIAAS